MTILRLQGNKQQELHLEDFETFREIEGLEEGYNYRKAKYGIM